MSVMALAASNWTFSSLLVVVAVSQGVQTAAAYSSMLCTIAMQIWRQSIVCHLQDGPPRARRRLMRLDIDWQSFHTSYPKVSCRSYLTHKKIVKGLQNIRFPSMVMLGCQAASAQSRLKKTVWQLDVLRVNLALADQATTLSTSGCMDAKIMSLLQALRAINRPSA